MHSCGEIIPVSGILDGYKRVKNTSCTYCDEVCSPPTINASISWFQGFNSKLVFQMYIYVGIPITFMF